MTAPKTKPEPVEEEVVPAAELAQRREVGTLLEGEHEIDEPHEVRKDGGVAYFSTEKAKSAAPKREKGV